MISRFISRAKVHKKSRTTKRFSIFYLYYIYIGAHIPLI